MKSNAHVQQQLIHLQNEWTEGANEGVEANPNVLPTFFYKRVIDLTAREQGYIFGRQLILHFEDKECEP